MKIIDNLKKRVEIIFDKSCGSHDFDHTIRVCNLCNHIGVIEKADMDVLQMSALLHDVARDEQDKSRGDICHAERGAEMARLILVEYGVSPGKIDHVAQCIETHSFRKGHIPKTKEAKILFDADKLDGIGAVGIGRAFLFSGEIGAKLHNDKFADLSKTKSYSREDTAYREFSLKLCRIKDKMFTKEGKRLAKERHFFMKEYFERMQGEVDGKF